MTLHSSKQLSLRHCREQCSLLHRSKQPCKAFAQSAHGKGIDSPAFHKEKPTLFIESSGSTEPFSPKRNRAKCEPRVREGIAPLLAAAFLSATCAVEPPLEQVSFAARFAGAERDVSQPLVVQSNTGWTVTLTAAEVTIGPIYFYNGAPGSGTNESNGRVVAQVLTQFTVDALNPQWGTITGASGAITETARSAEVRLTDGPTGGVAHVAGIAQKAGRTITFDATLRLPLADTTTAYQGWTQHLVQRIGTSFLPDTHGQLSLRVDASHWFDAVDFVDAQGAPITFTDRTSGTQLLQGIRSAQSTFHFSWDADGQRP